MDAWMKQFDIKTTQAGFRGIETVHRQDSSSTHILWGVM